MKSFDNEVAIIHLSLAAYNRQVPALPHTIVNSLNCNDQSTNAGSSCLTDVSIDH